MARGAVGGGGQSGEGGPAVEPAGEEASDREHPAMEAARSAVRMEGLVRNLLDREMSLIRQVKDLTTRVAKLEASHP